MLGGTIVTADADGRADVPTAGQNALGISISTVDNRTTSPEGGAAGALKCQVSFGVHGLAYAGTKPKPGEILYVVDNQTVSTDSDSGARGLAGSCTEVFGGQCYVYMGPVVVGLIVIAASEASQLDTAQTDIANLQTDMAIEVIPISIGSGRIADGTSPAAFSDGVSDGFVVSEGLMYRYNVNTTAPLYFEIPLPDYLDGGEDIEVKIRVSREGATDTDLTAEVAAFFISSGDVYTADADCGGTTGVIDQATTVVSEETVTIAAADVPAAPLMLGLSVMPTTALLNSDDMNLHSLLIRFARTTTS